MNIALSDGPQQSKELQVASSLRKQRWALLATGLALSAFLVVFLLGAIPGYTNIRGLAGTIVVSIGAAFVAAAGIVCWWLWTRLANFRTGKVLLTDQGIHVEFVNGSVVELEWTDPGLRFVTKEFSNQAVIPGVSLQWGSGGIGRYAHISRLGTERLKSEAISRGLRGTATSTGKPPNVWVTTEFSRS